MNIVAVTAGAAALFIPLALVYRALNPAKVKVEPPKRRVTGAIYQCDIRHMHEAWKGRPTAEMVAHYASEAALDAAQVNGDAENIARAVAFDSHPVVQVVCKSFSFLCWSVILLLGLALLLIVAIVVGHVLSALLGTFTLSILLCYLLCMSDIRQIVREEVAKK